MASNVEKFEELLRGDSELQAKVREAASSFEGDPSDEQALFDATLGMIAAGVGLPISYDDAFAFASSERELNDAELDAVAGGLCYASGDDNQDDTKCYTVGSDCIGGGIG